MRRFSRDGLLSLVLLALFTTPLWAGQNNGTAQSPKRPTSTPYTGDLSVFESPGREQRLQINRVMDILGIMPGKTVADIGAGSGWFTASVRVEKTDSKPCYCLGT